MLNKQPKNQRRWLASLEATHAMRHECSPDMRPLYEHCIRLALDSYEHGYCQRAGIELRAARKAASLTVKP